VLIRHGETDWNREHRFQGSIDVPLNDAGRAQAARLAARLRAEPPDALYVSDLLRARQTAAPLAAAWGLPAEAGAAWREQAFGLFEGELVSSLVREHPGLWAQWWEQDADFELPGGAESNRRFHARVWAAARELAVRHAGAQVVVVTHGGVLDMLWRTARALPISGRRECEIPNTGINRLRLAADEALEIDLWADDAHLR
jgi:probable phosphoglycerate mutase